MSQTASTRREDFGRGDFDSRIVTPLFWTLVVLLGLIVVVAGPILTSDGLAHVSMANFLSHAGDPAWPMLNRLYEINWTPTPNALGELFMAALMLIVPPLTAEQIMQILCLISVPLAARLTLRRLAPGSGWLALFFFPVALERMFFLGLYNYCLSLSSAILCIWAYLRLRSRVTAANGVVVALLLLLTLACQASGWLEAALALATLVLSEFWLRRRAGEAARSLWRLPAITLLSVVPGVLLFALFALAGAGDRHIKFGPSVPERLAAVFLGDAFAPIGRTTSLVSLLAGLTLIVLALSGGIAAARTSVREGADARRLRIAMGLLPLSFLGFLLIVPDEAGGGWTHTWRAQVFPYVGLALACGTLPIRRGMRAIAAPAAALGGLIMIGTAAWVQLSDVPAATREFNEADAFIGPHCTIAPVLTQFKLDPANSARLFYHPLFHLANRFELRGDRPVLFSYVARLPVYPVRFRPNADTQRLLYGWLPSQRDTRVYHVDIAGYEGASGIPVDYVLLWDFPKPDQPGLYHDLRLAVTDARYQLVHRSSGGRMELYRRPGPGGCAKP